MITTTNILTQNDIKQYLLQCDIADLTEDKIFFGWKQGKKAQLQQWKNKYNITIINDGKETYGLGAKRQDLTIEGENAKKKTYRALNKFTIKVFNWYGCLGDGAEKDYYDCEEVFYQVVDSFINHSNIVNYKILEPQSGFHEVFASSFLEYGIEITIYNDIEITKINKDLYIDNAILKSVQIIK